MPVLQQLPDDELKQLLVEGDYAAFEALYSRHYTDLSRFMMKFLHSSELTEDAAQEVFIKIWENRIMLTAVKVFKAYLYIIARNHAIDSLRKGFRSVNTIKEIVSGFCEQGNSAEDDFVSREYLNFIEKTLQSIPSRSREIFLMCREQSKSYDEVGRELGISRNAVKNHMVFAMKVLRTNAETELGITLSVLLAVFHR